MFKVGDRVKDNPKSEEFGIVTWTELGRTRVKFSIQECWYNDSQLIPETDDQIRQSLIDAGFEAHTEFDSYYRHQKDGSVTVQCDRGRSNWVLIEDHADHDPLAARSVVQIECKSFSDARDLAICLLRVAKS